MAGDLYLLVGLPGSGKTTWANSQDKNKFVILSTDELSKAFRGFDKEKRRTFEIHLAREHLKKGRNVILDKMLMSKESRQRYIKALKPYANKIYVILFDVPLLRCLERNKDRPSHSRVSDRSYISHIKRFEPPSKDEGYDELRVERPL